MARDLSGHPIINSLPAPTFSDPPSIPLRFLIFPLQPIVVNLAKFLAHKLGTDVRL